MRVAPERDFSYRGVSAPQLKRVDDEPVVTEIPKVSKSQAFQG